LNFASTIEARGKHAPAPPVRFHEALLVVDMRIFVAEDSPIMVRHLVALLTGIGGIEIVGQTHDAREAARAIRELKPDVVTLDLQLVGGSGIDVLKKIKQEEPGPIVIVLTNCTSPPFRRRSVEAGADFFLDKTTELHKIKEIIQNLLAPGDRHVGRNTLVSGSQI
jgi:DNA-binding NarL/FixJ family response regulator